MASHTTPQAPKRKLAAFTTFSEQGYETYGRKMLEAFDRHWPADIPLRVYYEGSEPEIQSSRIEYVDLHASSPGLVDFKKRHSGNAAAHGQDDRGPLPFSARGMLGNLVALVEPLLGKDRQAGRALESSRKRRGIGYRWDAVRFAHKTYCILDATESLPADAVFWIDADTLTFLDIPRAFIESTLPPEAMLSFIGRRYRTSECGYVGYNLQHPRIRDFLAIWRELYDSDSLFELDEWHDSWVFDWVRGQFKKDDILTHNLSGSLGWRSVHHPFVNGPLGAYMDHMKGERKQYGRSLASDLMTQRDESYWQSPKDEA